LSHVHCVEQRSFGQGDIRTVCAMITPWHFVMVTAGCFANAANNIGVYTALQVSY